MSEWKHAEVGVARCTECALWHVFLDLGGKFTWLGEPFVDRDDAIAFAHDMDDELSEQLRVRDVDWVRVQYN